MCWSKNVSLGMAIIGELFFLIILIIVLINCVSWELKINFLFYIDANNSLYRFFIY